MKKTIKQKALAGLAILSLSTLAFANSNQAKSNRTSVVTSTVSVAQTQEKALKEAKGGKVIGYEQDVKYGNNIYEVTILDGKYEKEYKIDGQSGAILKSKTKDLSRDDEDQAIIGATYKSEEGRGSLFRLTFPLIKDKTGVSEGCLSDQYGLKKVKE